MLYLVFCVLKPFQNRLLAMLPGGWNSLEWTEGKNEVRDLHECPLSLAQAVPSRHRQHLCLTEITHTSVNPVLVAETRACFVPRLRKAFIFCKSHFVY